MCDLAKQILAAYLSIKILRTITLRNIMPLGSHTLIFLNVILKVAWKALKWKYFRKAIRILLVTNIFPRIRYFTLLFWSYYFGTLQCLVQVQFVLSKKKLDI